MAAELKTGLKVACITCYFDPDYVRSRTLRSALAEMPDVELIVIKNTSKGAKRYVEVLRDLWHVRREKPDVYWLNFRGYELLPFVLLLAGRKPVVYDEMINPVLVVEEHRRNKRGIVKAMMKLWVLLGRLYYLMIRRCYVILTDTDAHAAYSSEQSGIDVRKYRALPVGADETVFFPAVTRSQSRTRKPGRGGDWAKKAQKFQVFFYSSGSQPLHGMPVIMQAAGRLADRQDIEFLVAGTKGDIAGQVAAAQAKGAHIKHEAWIPFEELPDVIRASGVCLGGPFGGTPQAQVVVTTKAYQFIACGAPVIVGQSPAMTDFVDRQNSLVVPQADPDALAATIAWAADNPTDLQRIAQAGRKLYETEFSASVIGVKVADILQPLFTGARADSEALAGVQGEGNQEQ